MAQRRGGRPHRQAERARNAASSVVGAAHPRRRRSPRPRHAATPGAAPPVAPRRSRSPRPGGGGSDRWRCAAIRAIGVAPRAAACARLSITRKQPTEPSTMPPPAACRAQTGANGRPVARLLPQHAASLVVQQRVRPLGVERAADQEQIALARRDPRAGDAHRVGARGLLAHEGARGADHAVHQRDVARQQVGKLREEQRRPQIGQQLLVQQRARDRRRAGRAARIASSAA